MNAVIIGVWVFVVIVIVICGVTINAMYELQAQCEADGGILIRQFGWWMWRCVKVEDAP